MKKIPTMFLRDESGKITEEKNPECAWVFDGVGYPMRKLDGMCCRIDEEGRLWKRREAKKGKEAPEGFVLEQEDENTGKLFGWLLVGDGPEDKYFREARASLPDLEPGTYELLGPKVQGNPEGYGAPYLELHGDCQLPGHLRRSFEGIKEFLRPLNIEGIVFHGGPMGQMAKVKKKDFGLPRKPIGETDG